MPWFEVPDGIIHGMTETMPSDDFVVESLRFNRNYLLMKGRGVDGKQKYRVIQRPSASKLRKKQVEDPFRLGMKASPELAEERYRLFSECQSQVSTTDRRKTSRYAIRVPVGSDSG